MAVENRMIDQTGRFQYCVQADGTAAILNCLERIPELRIPEYLDDLKVTALLDGSIEQDELETVYISMAVSKIEDAAFMADNIKEIIVDERNPWFRTLDGVLLETETDALIYCPPDAPISELRVPVGVRSIGKFAFSCCSNLRRVVLSEGVTEIEHGAFEHCENMTDLYIPSSVAYIGDQAFDDCPKLTLWVHNGCYRRIWGYFRENPDLNFELVSEEPDFMHIFLKDEKQRIDAIADTEESFREWYTHYATLTPKQQALAGYLLTAARKDSYADDYMGLQLCPVSCADQKNVNNGYGIMFSIRRECFPQENAKFIYLRSDMWIPPQHDFAQIPDWIRFMEDEVRKYSSGLSEVQTEVIPSPFGEEGDHCYAITFQLDPAAVRECISMFGECWNTKEIGQYIFSLTDITGEFGYVLGVMEDEQIISLWEADMYFK